VAENLGYTSFNEYNLDVRKTYSTNWAITAFIINTGYQEIAAGIAYVGSGFHVINENIFGGIFAHETLHMFGAYDEHQLGASCDVARNGVMNSNARKSPCNGTLPCLMATSREPTLCEYTLAHIGWTVQTPAPRSIFPAKGDVLEQGSVSFRWNRGKTDPTIFSAIEITDTETNAVVYCERPSSSEDHRSVDLPPGRYSWVVVNGGGYNRGYWARTSSAATEFEIVDELPKGYTLLQNYPNPFNPTTKVQFTLPTTSLVKLVVYSLQGEEITTIVDGRLPAGLHENVLRVNLSGGIYLYRLVAAPISDPSQRFVDVKKMLLVK
jgi:hypothetical protein